MKQKTRRVMAAAAAIFSLMFQSAAPAAIFAEELAASDSAEVATPTPEITPTDAPSPTPEATPEATPTADITPTPTVEPEATPTQTQVWIVADDGAATTSSLVILGQRYQAPQNSGVSVTFSRLPETPGYLSIKEVNLTEEERAGIGAISTTAYEITSTMENGAFTYNLTLPYVDDNDDGVIGPDNTSIDSIGVAVSEDGSEYAPVEQAVTQKDQKLVEITGLDHFTVFVLVNDVDGDNGGDATDDIANGTLSVIDDTWVDENSPTTTHGTSADLYVRSDGAGVPDNNRRSFVKFDVSPIETNAQITKATLRLFLDDAPASSAGSRTYQAYRVTGTWTAASLDWDPQPSSAGPTDVVSSGTTNGVWLEWDVTSDVQSFVNEEATNFGWMIRDAVESNAANASGRFNSGEDSNELRRPQLVVDFALSDDQPTEYNSPSNQELVVVGDDENGFETNPTNAFADGGGFASNINGDDDAHLYYDYNFTVPGGATINGIEVRADWYLDDEAGTNSLDVALSWSGGTNWTSTKSDATETDKEHVSSLGGASDTWGRDWSPGEFSNDNFRVRVSSNTSSSSRDFFLDWIPVRVYYTPVTTGSLIVKKHVNNDNGGSKLAGNFNLHVSAGDIDVLGSPAAGDEDGVSYTLEAGDYEVGEDNVSGYSSSFSGNCDSEGIVTVAAGETKTCTITNDDQPARLTVIKQVINDDGGSATAANFTMTVEGTNVSDDEFSGSEDGTTVTLDAGDYSVDEQEFPGYEKSLGDGCSGSLANGESRVCTVTNDDIAPVLTLVKEVVTNDGGQAGASDWTLIADGIERSFSGFGPTVGPNEVFAGVEYTLAELGPDGYTASSWQCDGGFLDGNKLTLEPGDNVTCTIVNDDQAGTLIVRKVIKNDNGGQKLAEDFSFQVNGGATIPFEADGENELTVNAGTYSAAELETAGYETSYDNCSDVVVANGGTATCTITNDDQPGEIQGMKFEDENGNGEWDQGEEGLSGWTIYVDVNGNGELDIDELPTETDEDGQYSLPGLAAGSYQVQEIVEDGWTQTTAGPDPIELENGETVEGVNFGNFELGRIRGEKFEDTNGDGVFDDGEPRLGGWTIFIDSNDDGQLNEDEVRATTNEDGRFSFDGLTAGTYRVREVLQDGWTQTAPEDGSLTFEITSGADFGGAYFGNFQDVTITVYKWEDWDGDGEWDDDEPFIGDWPMTDSIVTTRTSSGTDGVPFQTEIIELQLSSVTASDSGQVNFKVSKPGTHRIEEGSKDNFQRTYPVDSFFDIFVELGGENITEDKDGNPLWFGNIFFEEVFGGMFAPTNGDADSTPGATILGDTMITVPEDGANTILFPDGTVVTRSDGENLDISDLSGSSPALGSLTGLGSGVVADGGLQWGLVDLGLEFSQPITVNIFVGTSFNGQTLNVVRSTSGSSGWTNDGIVAPATCTVADGFCTFQATKASFYVATHTTSTETTSSSSTTSDGGGGGDSGGGVAACGDTKPGSAPTLISATAGLNSVNLTWSAASDPVTYYLVAYGTAPGSLQYGNPNIGGKGMTGLTVSNLSGGTRYYFRVRAGNGCMPGDYSNELGATPSGGFVTGPAAGFAEGVLGVETENTSEITVPTPVLTPFLTPKPTGGKVLGQESGKWNWWWLLLIIPVPAALLWWWSGKKS